MAEEPAELTRRIEEQRQRVDRSMDELGDQFEMATDWKTYVRQHPWWALGAGVAGGLVLSGLATRPGGLAALGGAQITHQAGAMSQRIDNLFGAAVAALSDELENAVINAFPVLRNRYSKSA